MCSLILQIEGKCGRIANNHVLYKNIYEYLNNSYNSGTVIWQSPSIIGYFYVSHILAKHTWAFVIIFPS